jgi:hypothetical protein
VIVNVPWYLRERKVEANPTGYDAVHGANPTNEARVCVDYIDKTGRANRHVRPIGAALP